jgi:hypothetical protein
MPDTDGSRETCLKNRSRNEYNASRDSVDDAIMNVLSSGPKRSGQLKKAVQVSISVSDSQFYKKLRALRESDTISYHQSGKLMLYSLPEHKDQLLKNASRASRLERHVVDNAHYLIDLMLKTDVKKIVGDSQEIAIQTKCSMLHEAVEKLHQSHPRVPLISDPAYKDGVSEGGVSHTYWYRYWLDVLEYFKEY